MTGKHKQNLITGQANSNRTGKLMVKVLSNRTGKFIAIVNTNHNRIGKMQWQWQTQTGYCRDRLTIIVNVNPNRTGKL